MTGIKLLALVLLPAMQPGDALEPDMLRLEAATLRCVGVRWTVRGDRNRNAVGFMEYRVGGKGRWQKALPLFRVDPSTVADNHRVPDMFAGSVFDLEPGTEVELRVALKDPDGGGDTRTIKARTKVEPRFPAKARVRYAVPGNGGGDGSAGNPWKGLGEIDPKPGDVVVLGKGAYQGNWTIRASGTEQAPIYFRGDGAVLEGGSPIVSINSTEWLWFENLTFVGGDFALVGHGAANIVVSRCAFLKCRKGITATREDKPIHDWYVADNSFEGPSSWPRSKGIEDTEGVQLVGTGHVVCYNRIRGFADGISIFRSPASGIDFYNNDVSECTDDGIEMDYGESNVRCFDNRLTNCFVGVSAQPVYGGPCYILRNVIYNTEYGPLKLHNGTSGLLIHHNTSVRQGTALCVYAQAPVSNAIFRNNLFIGTGTQLADWTSPAVRCDLDYNGWGEGRGQWKIGNVRMNTLKELEPHGTLVGDAGLPMPDDVKKMYPPPLLMPNTGKGMGIPLPNVSGEKSYLGALVPGLPPPNYGPRAPESSNRKRRR